TACWRPTTRSRRGRGAAGRGVIAAPRWRSRRSRWRRCAPRPPRVAKAAAGPRRRAREVAFRVAYQADVTGDTVAVAWQRRQEEERLTDDQSTLVADVVSALDARGEEI